MLLPVFCTYCTLQKANAQLKNQKEDYDSIALAKELKKRNLIGAGLHIDCAPGEIAIHPNRNAYYDFIEENAESVTFYSNAAKYDERLADILRNSSKNKIIISMDSGTAETFHKVKGVNAYNKVCENLHKYRESSGQIILKYILLDENCNSQDAEGFIELCKTLKIAKIDISADLGRKTNYLHSTEPEQPIVDTAVQLIRMAIKNRIKFSIYKKAFGNTNLNSIQAKLMETPEILEVIKQYESVGAAQRIIFYGMGANAKVMLKQMRALEMKEPDEYWDIKVKREDISVEISKEVVRPDFESLNNGRDVVVISIINASVNQKLVEEMGAYGFSNVFTYRDFSMALMAKRFQKKGIDCLGW